MGIDMHSKHFLRWENLYETRRQTKDSTVIAAANVKDIYLNIHQSSHLAAFKHEIRDDLKHGS